MSDRHQPPDGDGPQHGDEPTEVHDVVVTDTVTDAHEVASEPAGRFRRAWPWLRWPVFGFSALLVLLFL
ncbi:MAG TPA: hypothetical protein VGE43_18085, partial [Acidimicrobiales bacterium]